MVLPLVIATWILALTLILCLCQTAQQGDTQSGKDSCEHRASRRASRLDPSGAPLRSWCAK
jgi:hypothetical protein